ncbi:hypothetical protein WCN79_17820 [Xanthomonas axonopodis pv. vasculorum]|uniref:hypothetical protein n=1 Tax=Xanthomonas axonopodis TaxID=53413 RepID=UPI001FD45A95|nr:hypothetical protein [Xanthomonas axonopodis]
MIEAEPSFGYRTVAALLGMNKNTVQRIFQLKGWQVRKRALGQRPRIEAKVSAPRSRINAGPLICVAFGAARTAGRVWRW